GPCSGLGGVPGVVEKAVARFVAGLGVLAPVVERTALVGPLLAAVVAGDHAPVAGGGVFRGCHQRWPVGGAAAVAYALAGPLGVFVEDVERHLVGADQHAVHGGGRGLRLGRG